jgi:hypothetical protein
MSDKQWSEDSQSPAPKKGLPTWAWFVGGGCLLMILIAVIIGWFGYAMVKEARDPEQQWPRVAKALPFDERPKELTPKYGNHLGVDTYFFTDSRGYMAMLFHLPATKASEMRKQFMDPNLAQGPLGMNGRRDIKSGNLRVQGRDIPFLRFFQDKLTHKESTSEDGSAPEVGTGASMMLDLTPEDGERPVILQLIRITGGDAGAISDETVIEFLKPFHVGSQR